MNDVDAKAVNDGGLDPRLYEMIDLESRCSADTIWGEEADVDPEGTAIGHLGLSTGAGTTLDGRGFTNTCAPHGVSETILRCCKDSTCPMWNETIGSDVGKFPRNSGSTTPGIQVKDKTYYNGDILHPDVYGYRGRCLKADDESCTEDKECYSSNCVSFNSLDAGRSYAMCKPEVTMEAVGDEIGRQAAEAVEDPGSTLERACGVVPVCSAVWCLFSDCP